MLFTKKTPEDQGKSAGWISSLLGGSARSDTGQVVTPTSAMGLPMGQICVSLLAESAAQLPREIYRRLEGGGREAAKEHPLYNVLKYRPNGWQTPYEYLEGSQIAAGLRGNAYSFIERSPEGEVVGLIPLSNVTVLKGPDLLPYYRIGNSEPLAQRHIHHVRWFSLDNYVGVSPIALHANTLGHAQALAEYSAKTFVNGTALSGVLERPKEAPKFDDPATARKITDDWEARFGGVSNAAKVALLQEGMTFRPLSMSNVDADLVKVLGLSDADIARIYKVPAPMAGIMEGATYNNVENLQIQFVVYALMPWLRRHEQAMQRDLLNPDERDTHYIEFNVGGLLRGNQQARYAAYAVGRQWGWLSINDIRRLENLPPIPGGDVYLQPLNMVDASDPQAAFKSSKPDNAAVDQIAEALK